MGFVFVVLSAALTTELYFDGEIAGTYWGPQGPMIWTPDVAGCGHCPGSWLSVSFPRYFFELLKVMVFIPVGTAFVVIAYWHYWEPRHAAD